MTKPNPSRSSRIGQIDLDTGEVMEHATMALILRRGRNGFGKRWFAMGQDPAIAMAERGRELGRDGFMVFMFLIGSLDYENEIAVSQAEIGSRLGLAKQNVSRAMKRLLAMEVIEEGRKFGSMKSYKLNPSFGWKGKGSNHIKALQAA